MKAVLKTRIAQNVPVLWIWNFLYRVGNHYRWDHYLRCEDQKLGLTTCIYLHPWKAPKIVRYTASPIGSTLIMGIKNCGLGRMGCNTSLVVQYSLVMSEWWNGSTVQYKTRFKWWKFPSRRVFWMENTNVKLRGVITFKLLKPTEQKRFRVSKHAWAFW